MTVRVIESVDAQTLERIGRLRYQVYIKEQGKNYESANHISMVLLDRVDEVSTHFVAVDDNDAIYASLRYTKLSFIPAEYLIDEGFENVLSHGDLVKSCSLSSRLIISESFRGDRSTLAGLFDSIYNSSLEMDDIANFIQCRSGLEPIFYRLGFRNFGEPFVFKRTGELHTRLMIRVDSIFYLDSVKSRFSKLHLASGRNKEHPHGQSVWHTCTRVGNQPVQGGIK